MISVLDLGVCDYATALRLQERLVELRKQRRVGDVLLLLEHPPVITLGRNAQEANIIASPELLKQKGVETFEINRGGDVTFHGPGQLVAYPIFDLRAQMPRLGVVDYVRRLEAVLMRICGEYRMETQRIKGMTGVWTYPTMPPRLEQRKTERDYVPDGEADDASELRSVVRWSERKVAAIGVHVSGGVTSHGFALNVTTDLSYFQLIVPCGLTKPVTSIEFETGERPQMEKVKHLASRVFGELFFSQVLWLESIDDLLATAESANHFAVSVPQDTPAHPPEELRRLREEDTHLA